MRERGEFNKSGFYVAHWKAAGRVTPEGVTLFDEATGKLG